MSDFLQIEDQTFLVFGVANKKSVAYHVGHVLTEAGARVIYSVRSESRRRSLAAFLPDATVFVCDVERRDEIERLRDQVSAVCPELRGFVHSIAFANYSEGMRPFHEINEADFFQAFDISCFSLLRIANQFKDLLHPKASVVTITVTNPIAAAENYGCMTAIKAALNASVVSLAKSFSHFSEIRFNAVGAGPLKTISSAGVPGFVEGYLFAEKLTLRKRALTTREVANTVAFLLSERSSGINGQIVFVDAGISINTFDTEIVRRSNK